VKKFILIAIVVAVLFIGCGPRTDSAQSISPSFQVIEVNCLPNNDFYMVMQDKQTGQQYLVVHVGYGTAITKIREGASK
jgi:hypothetical protein